MLIRSSLVHLFHLWVVDIKITIASAVYHHCIVTLSLYWKQALGKPQLFMMTLNQTAPIHKLSFFSKWPNCQYRVVITYFFQFVLTETDHAPSVNRSYRSIHSPHPQFSWLSRQLFPCHERGISVLPLTCEPLPAAALSPCHAVPTGSSAPPPGMILSHPHRAFSGSIADPCCILLHFVNSLLANALHIANSHFSVPPIRMRSLWLLLVPKSFSHQYIAAIYYRT